LVKSKNFSLKESEKETERKFKRLNTPSSSYLYKPERGSKLENDIVTEES